MTKCVFPSDIFHRNFAATLKRKGRYSVGLGQGIGAFDGKGLSRLFNFQRRFLQAARVFFATSTEIFPVCKIFAPPVS